MPSAYPPPMPPPPPPPQRRKWQFSLRRLLFVTTGFALFCGMLVVMPHGLVVLLGLAWYGASGVLLTGIIFGRGNQRAFCIGALVVVLSTWTRTGGGFLGEIVDMFDWTRGSFGVSVSIYIEAGLKYVVLAVLAFANGYLCIHARRYFERHANED